MRPLLIVSGYLPTKGCHHIDDYKDSIVQLYEICIKYNTTHNILTGGDIHEDLSKENGETRSTYIKQFINECNLNISYAESTYINPQGQDCSEIDYFLFSKDTSRTFTEKCVRKDMTTNLSDHYPITITCDSNFEQRNVPNKLNIVSRIKWDKVDKNMYSELVKKSIQMEANDINKLEAKYGVEHSIISISNILRECSKRCIPPKRKNQNKGKLQIWTEAISNAYKEMRKANNQWYEAGRPRINHPTI